MQTNTTAVEVYFGAEEVCFTVTVEILDTVSIGKVSCFELGHDLLQSCGTLGALKVVCENAIGCFVDRY